MVRGIVVIVLVAALIVLTHNTSGNGSYHLTATQEYNSACLDLAATGCVIQGSSPSLQGSSPDLQGN